MPTPLPKQIEAALARLEPAIRDAFLEAVGQIKSAVLMAELEAAIAAGNIEAAIEALRLEQGFFGPLYEAQRTAFLTGGGLIMGETQLRNPFDGSRYEFSFNARADRAETWVRDQSSRLITNVIEEQKEQTRIVLREAMEVGEHPRSTARAIVGKVNATTGKREGGLMGLDGPRAGVLKAITEGMKTADGVRDLVVVPRDGSPPYVRLTSVNKATANRILAAHRRGEAVPAADRDVSERQLSNKLLKDRGDTIARTEALNALRSGRHEGFQQLIDAGKVRKDQVRIRWQATLDSRVRDSHRHLHDQVVKLGEFFNPAPGVFMQYPGDVEHSTNPKALAANTIQCRCLAVYRIRSDLMRYDDD